MSCGFIRTVAQDHFIFPDHENWNEINEDTELKFQLKTDDTAVYSLVAAEELGIRFDSLGNFSWKPSYDLVDRVALRKEFTVVFEATYPDGARERKNINFIVHHVNRAPVVEELPVF